MFVCIQSWALLRDRTGLILPAVNHHAARLTDDQMPLTSRLNNEIVASLPHLQNNLHVIRVSFAFLVAPEFGTAVQERSDNTGLLRVYRGRRDK